VASHVFVVGGDPDAWSGRGLDVVPDDLPGSGALGGIYTAIMRSPRERTLVLACDMPFVSAAFLRRLADEDADVVMPRSHRGCEPLCAVYSRVCAPDIRARIDRGELQACTPPRGVRVAARLRARQGIVIDARSYHD
jgi:molybdopterin-guanine dinucleotide biosynthesis protein A